MVHNATRRDWPRLAWQFPRIHNYNFGFGLSAEDANKASTIVPYVFQDNALIDYETIKTNPENADFAVVAYPNTCAGSYIPKIQIAWSAFIPTADTEIISMKFNTMMIHTNMLNRLTAFDKKTGTDTEAILELTHETTDEQCYPLWNNTKLFEGAGTYDYDALVPGLTSTQQPEGVAFDKELFFDAQHYYTNKEMLRTMTDRMKTHLVSEPIVPHGRSVIEFSRTVQTPSLSKFQHPYQLCAQLFHIPQVGSRDQLHLAGETTAIEHLTVKGWVRFFEFNPDFNFSRA